ncbi:hypothetical protein B0H17DRAFT_1062604 [Mycena rosella]|uniref:Peptidase M43 pregnancy-associated plasma-A domain-containing protein n=1 Tax=Mycena rosella TaxID=1033263 RepID=A0AAD7DHA2_MYCRO|nr:hypothetical protein B0H17DRAFT_1062604 [Mycena rosella]
MLSPASSRLLLILNAVFAVVSSPLYLPQALDLSVGLPPDLPDANLTAHAVKQLRCGTDISLDDILLAEEQFNALQMELVQDEEDEGIEINVHWTIISNDGTLSGGNLPDSQIADQIEELNANCDGAFVYTLVSTSRVVNADWFSNAAPGTTQQTAMKQAHRKGGHRDLNVYSVGFMSGAGQGLLGYATFPFHYRSRPMDDGVVLQFATVPGGAMTHYNLGRTLTHEVGHWLGLYHTFQGGCTERNPNSGGDYVSDTPAEASGASGCPTNRMTCSRPSGDPSVDPIHNFMDYSYDECMDQFTPGQMARASAMFAVYRPKE